MPTVCVHAPQENVRWCANLIQMGADIDGSPAQQRLQQQVHLFLEVLISMCHSLAPDGTDPQALAAVAPL